MPFEQFEEYAETVRLDDEPLRLYRKELIDPPKIEADKVAEALAEVTLEPTSLAGILFNPNSNSAKGRLSKLCVDAVRRKKDFLAFVGTGEATKDNMQIEIQYFKGQQSQMLVLTWAHPTAAEKDSPNDPDAKIPQGRHSPREMGCARWAQRAPRDGQVLVALPSAVGHGHHLHSGAQPTEPR